MSDPASVSVARVAAIVPAYNRADLLPDALHSLLGQTYQDWTATVVDDGSSDHTWDVAQSFAARDPRIRALRLERNVGMSGARNAGIEARPHVELLFLLDSDDYLRADCLERLVQAYDYSMAAGRRVGVISCNARILGPDGFTGETWLDRGGRTGVIDLDSMLRRNHLLGRGLFPRAVYDEVGGAFASECWGTEDYDLWLRMLEAGYQAIALPEPLVVYRDHPGASSRDLLSRAAAMITAYRRALGRGALSPRQRAFAWGGVLHYRAFRERELLYEAIAQRRALRVLQLAGKAVPLALAAFVERPSRWGLWLKQLLTPATHVARLRRGRS